MSKFTPGPWRVSADGINVGPEDAFAPFDGCGCCGSPWMSAKDGLSDARLIAAAPDLYEALRSLLDSYLALVNSGDCGNWNPESEREVIAARAALAKVDA